MPSPRRRLLTVLCAALAMGLALVRPSAQSAPAPGALARALLDQYARGAFDAVSAALGQQDEHGLTQLLEQLNATGKAWIDAAGPGDRARRRLAAATLALEAARAGEWREWKVVQGFANMGSEPRQVAPGVVSDGVCLVREPKVIWSSPPKLIEWGCALLREDVVATPAEHLWQLAAVAVAERSEDFEFLIGSPFEARSDVKDQFEHLKHAQARFPQEPRFKLAQGIALESRLFQAPPKSGVGIAMQVLSGLANDPDVGAEANVRLGVNRFRHDDLDGARQSIDRAEDLTRDRYVRYLARYVRGRIAENQKHPDEAEREYRYALTLVPHAQSASIALAAVLSAQGRRAEAAALAVDAISATPPPDPWREYIHGDDRFWPSWIARLRAEIWQ